MSRKLKQSYIKTPLGEMIALADEKELYLLEFLDRKGLKKEIDSLKKVFEIVSGESQIHQQISKELKSYFQGKLKAFKTPFRLMGTEFQKAVWEALLKIPFGETRSYLEQAHMIQKPKAFRAVANANGCNQLAIIVPCHRVIQSSGQFGGYGGGIEKKEFLLDLERGSAHG